MGQDAYLEALAIGVLGRWPIRRAGSGPTPRLSSSTAAVTARAAGIRILKLLVEVDLALFALELLGKGEEGEGDEEDENPADQEAAPPHSHPVPANRSELEPHLSYERYRSFFVRDL